MSSTDLHLLAQEIESHGLVGHESAIEAVCGAARTAGLSPVLVDVLADPHQPEVARVRAFAMLTARLAGRRAPVRTTEPCRPAVRRPEPALAA
jgi:hypothetical protein